MILSLHLSLSKSTSRLFALAVVSVSGAAFGSESAQLDVVKKLGSGILLNVERLLSREAISSVADYQIGDEWGKKPVTDADIAAGDLVFVRSVSATAFFNTATAFYLGQFGGAHVMATNHHVLPFEYECRGKVANFAVLKKKYACSEVIGSWPEIDLALFTITVPFSDRAVLDRVGRNFEFKSTLAENTPLLTAGFGIAGNTARRLVVNQNADCRVMSRTDDFRLMADPDRFNPADYRAWSFATGCSVSHGDSGSAMVNRTTGAVVGLVWTGAIPKDRRVQNSGELVKMQKSGSDEIWSLLTYAVPAIKISETLRLELDERRIRQEHIPVVRDLLSISVAEQ